MEEKPRPKYSKIIKNEMENSMLSLENENLNTLNYYKAKNKSLKNYIKDLENQLFTTNGEKNRLQELNIQYAEIMNVNFLYFFISSFKVYFKLIFL